MIRANCYPVPGKKYYADEISGTCVEMCPQTLWADDLTWTCVSNCDPVNAVNKIQYAPLIHSCTQILMFISACINAKIQIGSLTIRLKHAFHNALQPGSCGVNVSSTLVCSFVLMVILQMFCRTANATNNAQLQDLLISGPPDVWCTAMIFEKITTKTHQQVQVYACRYVQGTATDTTLIRHASTRT